MLSIFLTPFSCLLPIFTLFISFTLNIPRQSGRFDEGGYANDAHKSYGFGKAGKAPTRNNAIISALNDRCGDAPRTETSKQWETITEA